MERILNEDERIRRAEEIYLKRNNRNISLLQDGESKVKNYFGSKILLHLLVLFNIAVVIFCLQNKDYIFTEEFLNECNQYNINISEKINQLVKNFLVEDTGDAGMENSTEQGSDLENGAQNDNQNSENGTNESTGSQNTEQNSENVGVAGDREKDANSQNDVNQASDATETAQESSSLSEMELDIENLKKIYKFVRPLEATVSSEFGARESEYQNVSGYHTGIDLAAEKGTPIKAAMQGIVTLVSSEGDYRKTC